ncbi:hypothetical protein SULI_13135 [Saccharolobus solfataricus]|uniref:DUF3782 domain-containing protein n=2 Tax=Saccharolobus solfataricus TaxID=2287 RepID=A0A0E3MEH8_SACSO|nr:hypothetical protein [Saccharolobus solfataricus]AKA74694.1 hypothetical protein SULB_2586 [Saccharolobus solfataricus]AKA77388.1 hypothetical protein SULC_2581 [Saccharolobus solfataricus]AKA80079.1 hypothetical protein SULA_2584 [Saccharolobus solfataricus]AZF69157.1 hypothetical protein SULG_13135 [Saccharolobus solfataricus]AZF71777.1 hypothetical protein SULH_13135 [Saccharolobus solfataricus]
MSSERLIDEILKNPQLISALADKVYEKLKDEIVIRKLEENTKSIQALQEAIKRHGDAIVSLQEAVKSLQEEVKRQGEAIVSLQKTVEKQGEAIVSLQEEVKRHGDAIVSLQEEVKRQGEAIVSLQKTVEKQGEAIVSLQEEVKRHGDAIVSLQEAVKSLQEEVKRQGEAIVSLQEEVKKHSKAILRLAKSQKRLSIELGSFTSRAGKGLERAMLKLYKKSLELHGVDPKRVKHGNIVDTVGIIEKGRSFEVDFYETNDYIYVFEIKNFSDKDVIDQVFVRKKLFSVLYNKPLKVFVVTNYIERDVKEKLEKEGVEIIASHVID